MVANHSLLPGCCQDKFFWLWEHRLVFCGNLKKVLKLLFLDECQCIVIINDLQGFYYGLGIFELLKISPGYWVCFRETCWKPMRFLRLKELMDTKSSNVSFWVAFRSTTALLGGLSSFSSFILCTILASMSCRTVSLKRESPNQLLWEVPKMRRQFLTGGLSNFSVLLLKCNKLL